MEKKLYRNEHDKMIAGVCSGLAAYMGMEVTVMRLLFLLLTPFAAGGGLIVYIILWIIVPVNPDPNAKLFKFKEYFDKQDPNIYTSANAFNNAGNTDTNKWNTMGQTDQSSPFYDPVTFKQKDSTGRVIGGLILLIIGLFFLVRELDLIPYWFNVGKLWPVVLIVVGVSFILKSRRNTEWDKFKDQLNTDREPIVTPPPAAENATEDGTIKSDTNQNSQL